MSTYTLAGTTPFDAKKAQNKVNGVYNKALKRIIDITLSFFGLMLLSWLFILLMLAVFIDDPGPIFFSQKRVGLKKNGEIKYFNIYKFRTMRVDTPHDTPTHMLENPEQYITRMGKILRKTSLDELPQIFNIFIGNMSVIGPRPALWNQYDLIQERDKYFANDVKPGLTGLAQINGRDELEIEHKARLDGVYVEKMSLWLDIKCFFGTIISVLKSDGIKEGASVEAEKETKDEVHK